MLKCVNNFHILTVRNEQIRNAALKPQSSWEKYAVALQVTVVV